VNEPKIVTIGYGGQGRTLAETILSKAIQNSEEMKLLQSYLDTKLTPEEIIKQQKSMDLKSNCFNQIKAKFEQLLKMYEAGCDGYVGLWRELIEYQEAEEHGLLIKLPCKVGDEIYEANIPRKIISTYKVTSIVIMTGSRNYGWELLDGIYSNINGFNEYALGRSVFLTREEAEKVLKGGVKN
jgi:hypothetical protein